MAMGGEPRQGALDEAGDGAGALVGVQLDVGEAGVVIDDGVGELVAQPDRPTRTAFSPVAGDGVAGAVKACVAFGVHVQQIPGAWPLVAHDCLTRRPGRTGKAVAGKDRVDGGVGDIDTTCDQPRSPPGAVTFRDDSPLDRRVGARRGSRWAAGSVLQAHQ
jgi:hypothetical protein